MSIPAKVLHLLHGIVKYAATRCFINAATFNSVSSLFDNIFDADAVYAHKWRRGEAIVWDNSRLMHSTVPLALAGCTGSSSLPRNLLLMPPFLEVPVRAGRQS